MPVAALTLGLWAPPALSCQEVRRSDRAALSGWHASLRQFNAAQGAFSDAIADGSARDDVRVARARRALVQLTSASRSAVRRTTEIGDRRLAGLIAPIGARLTRLAGAERALFDAVAAGDRAAGNEALAAVERHTVAFLTESIRAFRRLNATYCR